MAVTIFGQTFGDDGTGWRTLTYVQLRGGLTAWIREKRGRADLQTNPGSFYGDIIDLCCMGADLALQAVTEVKSRTIFTSQTGVTLQQTVSPTITKVEATQSTAVVYAYGAVGATVPVNTAVRASATASPFVYAAGVSIPAAPFRSYAIDVEDFAAGAYGGALFSVTLGGTPANYMAGGLDTGATVRNGLVAVINALPLVYDAHLGGTNPLNQNRRTLVVTTNGGPFTLSVTAPGTTLLSYTAITSTLVATPYGPTYAAATTLRVGPPFAGLVGYVNIDDAVIGRVAESDSQLRARYQVAQRGIGGGNTDAIRAAALADVAVGGGGARFAAVEHNPTGANPDAAGNVDHSVRLIIGVGDSGQNAANSLFRSKAAGDNTNGPEVYSVLDKGVPPKLQAIRIDRLAELWIAVIINVVVGPDWPTTGDPLTEIAQDVVDFIEAQQPSEVGVRVGDLPIVKYPNGALRGVDSFTVQLGKSPTQGGPYVYNSAYPVPQANAEIASVAMTNRQKARAQISNVIVLAV